LKNCFEPLLVVENCSPLGVGLSHIAVVQEVKVIEQGVATGVGP
jgi:hypothetical protein